MLETDLLTPEMQNTYLSIYNFCNSTYTELKQFRQFSGEVAFLYELGTVWAEKAWKSRPISFHHSPTGFRILADRLSGGSL